MSTLRLFPLAIHGTQLITKDYFHMSYIATHSDSATPALTILNHLTLAPALTLVSRILTFH